MSNSPPLTFGIQILPLGSWPDLRDEWVGYDEQGWDSLWLPDHLMPPSGEPGPILEGWTALAALAALTERAQVGILVSSNTFRHPSVVVKQAVTVDHIAKGRSILGLGAGWYDAEHQAFGIEFPETGVRVSQYAESLDLLDQFLRNDRTTFSGDWYTMREAPNRPSPIHRPRMPIMVGAHGPRTIGIAARHADIWNSRGDVDEKRERNSRVDTACEQAGRDPSGVTRSVSYFPVRTDKRPWDSVEAFTEWVDTYRAIGYTHFIFEAPPPERRDVAERIAQELLPEFRRG
ncbi:MAG: LLM class flavin-dependent oxidoreductase [Chloroflexia bacterium]|nr:LLM class flavin-dependent oxidoreductase [Chloroflexia bacterium]